MKARKTYQRRETPNRLPLLIGSIFLVLAGILIGTIVSSTTSSTPVSSKSTVQPIYSAEVLEIASHFLCSCGRCGDKELVSCTCDTAIQEKNLIRELLQKGNERESIISTMETMFGKKKS